MASMTSAREQPMRQLVALLPRLTLNSAAQPDFEGADPLVLGQIAEACELLQRVISLGVGAVGQLMAHASVEVETGEFGQEGVEALGWMLAELGDAAAVFMALAMACRETKTAARRRYAKAA